MFCSGSYFDVTDFPRLTDARTDLCRLLSARLAPPTEEPPQRFRDMIQELFARGAQFFSTSTELLKTYNI